MGTGGIGSLFHDYPYGGNSRIMNGFSLAFFFINLLLFLVFLSISICSAVMYPYNLAKLFNHPIYSLYVSCFPMGAVTVITVALTTVHEYWGFGGVPFLYVLWGFWWLDGILSFLCTFGLVFLMVTRHRHTLSSFSPLWFLPVVTLIVCSSTGQLIAARLLRTSIPYALLTMGVSVAMLFIGLSLALMLMSIYICRIIIEGFPNIDLIISSFIPLGPCGQGAYSFLIAGQNFQNALPWGGNLLSMSSTGQMLNVVCLAAAFLIWCIGIWWLVMALVAIAHAHLKGNRIPFKLTFWGLVFPNAVQAIGTIQLSMVLDAQFFRVLGAVYGAAVIALWFALAIPTLKQVFDGRIFQTSFLEEDLQEMANGMDVNGGKREYNGFGADEIGRSASATLNGDDYHAKRG